MTPLLVFIALACGVGESTVAPDLTRHIVFLGSNSLDLEAVPTRIAAFVAKKSLTRSGTGDSEAPIRIPADLAADLHIPPSDSFTYYSPKEAKKITFGPATSYFDSMTGTRVVSIAIPNVRTYGPCLLVRQASVGSVVRSRIVLDPRNSKRGEEYARETNRGTFSLADRLPALVRRWILDQFDNELTEIIEIWETPQTETRFVVNAMTRVGGVFAVFDERGASITPELGKDEFWTVYGVYDIDNDGKVEIHFSWNAGSAEPGRYKLLSFTQGAWSERE